MKRVGMIISALALAVAANAAVVTYTGPNGGNWSEDTNWSGGAAPAANDTAQIDSGTVVYLDFEWLPNPLVVNVDGTIDQQSAMRLWNVQVHVSSTGELDATGGGWLVLWGGGAEVNFDSGATLTQDSGRIQFGNNADQTLGFNLEATGFQTLSANLLHFDGYAGQTIKADMANYTGTTTNIVLMDLAGNNGMTDAIFQGLNLVVANTGATYPDSNLIWNEVTSAIELNIIDATAVDTDPPIVSLLGPNPQDTVVGRAYEDPGAVANDVVDGDLTGSIVVTGSVDTNTVGTYLLTYTAIDSSSNTGTAVRTVNVIPVPDGIWETDFDAPLPADGFDQAGTSNAVVSSGVLSLTDDGTFVESGNTTEPWEGTTLLDAVWRATSVPTNDPVFKGASVRVTFGGNAPDYELLDFTSILDTNNNQTVEIYSGNILITVLPGTFGPGMLTLDAEINTADKLLTYELTDGTITNSGSLTYPGPYASDGSVLGNAQLVAFGGDAEFDYIRVETDILPASPYVKALGDGEINLDLVNDLVDTGSVYIAYGSATNLDTTISLSGETHPGLFSVLTASPQTLPWTPGDAFLLEVEFDNSATNLLDGQTATGLVTIAWSEQGGGASGSAQVPVSASYQKAYVWDGSPGDDAFYNSTAWVGDVAPPSTNASVLFDTDVSDYTAWLSDAFTISANRFMRSKGNMVALRLGAGAILTVKTGGELDFRTDGGSAIAENGNGNVQITVESGAIAKVNQMFTQSAWTHTFKADASGVTTFDVGGLFLNGGTLVVDVSSYDAAANGTDLVLFDYQSLGGAGTFDTVTVVGGSGNVDYAYDIGGGDLGIALIVPSPLTAQGTPYTWLSDYELVVSNEYESVDLVDTDLDGLFNWEEYKAGTDPTNSTSVLTLYSVEEIAAGQFEIAWQGVSGKSYALQSKSDLVNSGWSTVQTGIAGVEPETVVTTSVATAEAFFQVEVE